jgi:hypothetical protein
MTAIAHKETDISEDAERGDEHLRGPAVNSFLLGTKKKVEM